MKGSFLVPHQWGGVTLKFGNIKQVDEGSNIHHKGHYSLSRKKFFFKINFFIYNTKTYGTYVTYNTIPYLCY